MKRAEETARQIYIIGEMLKIESDREKEFMIDHFKKPHL